jgi:hypothetical protein
MLPPRQNPRLAAARLALDTAPDAANLQAEGDQLSAEATCPQCGHKGPLAEFQAPDVPDAPDAPEDPDGY